jgi:hypothetical protein
MTDHTTRAHAKRSPSAAYRWVNCPGSIRMSEGIEGRRSSVYADEGTAAHMLAEMCLDGHADTRRYLGRVIDINGKTFVTKFLVKGAPIVAGRFEVTEEMADAVQLYLDTVRVAASRPGAKLYIELKAAFSADDFGTADATVFQPDIGRLDIFDLKYGSGVAVEVIDTAGNQNKQLVCYCEGVIRGFEGKTVNEIGITIVQPRLPHPDGPVRSTIIGPLELLDLSMDIEAAIEKTKAPDAPLVVGDWCKWCPAAGACPAYAQRALAVAQADFDDLPEMTLPQPAQMTPEQLARALDGLDLLEDWAKATRQHAYERAEAGVKIPRYKLVEKVGRRKWMDEDDAAVAVAMLGVDDAYEPAKLKSPAQIEKLVGKKDFGTTLAALCPAISSGTALVPDSDRRPEVVRSIEQHFDIIEEGAG